MEITREEATQSLNAIHEVTDEARRAMNASGGDLFLVVWGIAWMVGFAGNHFFPNNPNLFWLPAWIFGGVSSMLIIYHQVQNFPVQRSTSSERNIGFFWMFLFLYGVIFLSLLRPENHKNYSAYLCCLFMFAYVVMGLWLNLPLRENYLLWIGLIVTGTTLLGLYVLNPWFYLWMSVTGGGTLYLAFRYRWRSRRG